MINDFNAYVSWALVGLIWTVQLVHYPSFRYVPDFTDFHPHHTNSITLVVGPLMLAEVILAFLAVHHSNWSWQWLLPLFVVLLIWALTFFWAVPLHERLGTQRDEATIEALISANWPRTILWSLKAAWITYLLWGK